MWQTAIVFSENSWKIIKNLSLTKAVSKPIDSVGDLSQKSVRIKSKPPIEPVKALPYSDGEVKYKGVLKKGRRLKTRWGPAIVTLVISDKKVKAKWPGLYDGEYILTLKKDLPL